jgi:hypothetical protein
MFYETTSIDRALRFGDIVQGFISCTPNIDDPTISTHNYTYQIEISSQPFFVILSPCCSIRDKVISLTPLIKLRGTFFNNPFFVDDLTRINRPVAPEHSLPPSAWESMEPEEKAGRLRSAPGYVSLECFIYEKHDFFHEYTISRREGNISTRYYMIDFRYTFRVHCDKINSPRDAPIDVKRLQLTIDTRSELRDKISYYYSRVPNEDLVSIA